MTSYKRFINFDIFKKIRIYNEFLREVKIKTNKDIYNQLFKEWLGKKKY